MNCKTPVAMALFCLAASQASATTFLTEAGASISRERIDPGSPGLEPYNESTEITPHLMAGAYRTAGQGLLGVALDLDRSNGSTLLGLRALDYRYPLWNNLEVHGFLGGARLDDTRPAYGYYYGFGASYRLPSKSWSIGLDFRGADKMARDKEPGEPTGRQDIYFDVYSLTLSIQKRF
ncbi:hypothetical protein [Gallaecimonas xiamenensis]|uniref:Outer membrane protein beta-barrel domain-containing protein n=1 Tax=Gallaecimonas xiamenensis 3-C-1 TaxID=745411 RepID=K2K3E0_9GAMM|nr:hypothetical protein [Gallaecimonas xiamenensis]EKE77464.1 hypothetical protein B3C1_01595 [Gallaecimonas xiamenensis 3-C-1]